MTTLREKTLQLVDEMLDDGAVEGAGALAGAAASQVLQLGNDPASQMASAYVGGALGGALGPILRRFLRGRGEKLATAVVQDLQARLSPEQVDALSRDEIFLSALVTALQAATRTQQEEKIEILKNAVVNCALGTSLSDDERQVFLTVADEFTPSHVQALSFCAGWSQFERKHGRVLLKGEPRVSIRAGEAIALALDCPPTLADLIAADLLRRRFVAPDDHAYNSDPVFHTRKPKWTTPAGEAFLAFVTEPPVAGR